MTTRKSFFFGLVLISLATCRLSATGLSEFFRHTPGRADRPVRSNPSRHELNVADAQAPLRKIPSNTTSSPTRTLSRKEKKIAQEFNKAYELLLYADKAREEKAWSDALRLYEDARVQHSKLVKEHPDWQPGIVKFRLAYCDIRVNEIARLMQSGDVSEKEFSAPGEFVGPPRREEIEGEERSAPSEDPKTSPAKEPDELARIITAGKQLLKSGQPEDARAVLIQALGKDPDNVEARLLIGMAQCQQKSYNDAANVMKSLIREQPRNAHAYLVLGTAYFGLNQLDEAEMAMLQAIQLNPELGDAYFNLAQILLARNPPDKKKARIHYARALQLGIPSDRTLETALQEK